MGGELFRALGALLERPCPELEQPAKVLGLPALPSVADHTATFTFQLVPRASVYLSSDGQLGGEAEDRIAGFWRAVGLDPPEQTDHLAVMLASYAVLVDGDDQASDQEQRDRARHLRRVFLDEHLRSWLPIFLLKLGENPVPFYAAWAALVTRLLVAEIEALGSVPAESAHHRHASPIPSAPDCTLDLLLSLLLSPLRSGSILTRRELTEAARMLGVAGRVGERRYMLESMLRQRPTEVLEWLRASLAATEDRYEKAEASWRRELGAFQRRVARVRSLVETALA